MSGRNNLNLNHKDHVDATHNNNLNHNEIERRYRKERDIETEALMWANRFNNLKFLDFYRNVVRFYRDRDPARIQQHYETAIRGNPGQPGKLFTYLCKRDGV
jgi:hypothetical protein